MHVMPVNQDAASSVIGSLPTGGFSLCSCGIVGDCQPIIVPSDRDEMFARKEHVITSSSLYCKLCLPSLLSIRRYSPISATTSCRNLPGSSILLPFTIVSLITFFFFIYLTLPFSRPIPLLQFFFIPKQNTYSPVCLSVCLCARPPARSKSLILEKFSIPNKRFSFPVR